MKQISSKYIRIMGVILISTVILLFVAILVAYSQREALFNIAIERITQKAKREYGLNIKIKKATFSGLHFIDFERISLIPDHRDSLANISRFRVGIRLFPLLLGDVKLSQIVIENGKINLVRKDSISNYDFLFRKKGNNQPSEMNLSKLAGNLLNQVFYKIPDDMDIKNFEIKFKDDTQAVHLYITTANIAHNKLKSTIQVNESHAMWHVTGSVYPEKKQLDLALFADGKKVELPYIQQKFGLKLNFDTVRTQMRNTERDGDDLKISGSWAIKNLLINNPRIANHDIVIENGSIDADMRIGKSAIALDSSSVIHLKNLTANPFIRYTLYPQKIYELKLHTAKIDAQQLFDAFPKGMFESLEGTKVSGQLQYSLNLYLDSKQPDHVQFESNLSKTNFRILKWGKTDLQKINSPFIYTPYEYGKPIRNIIIGPQNVNFTPIDEISPNLKNALLTAEDPSFFSHKGFEEESIRKSIATNFQKKAFKRGGSTISMQLVKNAYLNRQKTLARKMEEMLIVWMIENERLCSKQRMFEVYLNLIEWGTNVYGVGEASHFYFGKRPADLNLGESIFLTSIVPHPKSGLHSFEPDGHLRSGLHSYFKLIGGLMARRGMIQPDTSAYGFYAVRLKESLRKQVSKVDTTSLDNDTEDKDDLFQQFFDQDRQDSIPSKN